jgi:hypothetical protein
MSEAQDSTRSEKMTNRRILRIVKKDGSTVDLNIVKAQLLPANSPAAIRVEQVSGSNFALSYNEEITGPFAEIERIDVVRESDG